jgi:hypothetical protein
LMPPRWIRSSGSLIDGPAVLGWETWRGLEGVWARVFDRHSTWPSPRAIVDQPTEPGAHAPRDGRRSRAHPRSKSAVPGSRPAAHSTSSSGSSGRTDLSGLARS